MSLRRFVLPLVLTLCFSLSAQQVPPQKPAQAVVPRLIRFSGVVKDVPASSVGITFSLHKSQEDKSSLWIETQTVPISADGKYTILLGATKAEGIPMDLFTSGEAQWLAVQVEGKPEQPRVLLVSVPYALKAAEAETLAGHAASEFVTNEKLTATVQQELHTNVVPGATTTTDGPLNALAVSSGPTNFSGTTTDQIVKITQSDYAGSGLVVNAHATAIKGTSTGTSGTPSGVRGSSASTTGFGVYGINTALSGATNGVRGTSSSATGVGVYANNTSTLGAGVGIKALSVSNSGTAIVATVTPTNGSTTGIHATVASPYGTAGVFDSQGKILSGRSGSPLAEVFSVQATGEIDTNSQIVAQGAISGHGGPGGADPAAISGIGANGVYGEGTNSGVVGRDTTVGAGAGVQGYGHTGVQGTSNDGGSGVYGYSSTGYGVTGNGSYAGLQGTASGNSGYGVIGTSTNVTGAGGLFVNTAGGKILIGKKSSGEVFSVSNNGQITTAAGLTTAGGIATSTITASGNPAVTAFGGTGVGVNGSGDVYGIQGSGGQAGTGVFGSSTNGYGVQGSSNAIGLYGTAATGVYGTGGSYGVHGYSSNIAVYGEGPSTGTAIYGTVSGAGTGVSGSAVGGQGLNGYDSAGGDGILAGSNGGYAAFFNGDVDVNGTLSKGAGSFKIDHPLDPANKYLYHSFVESPDMMNIYNGNVTTDAQGTATVELPQWFEALNRDFRYQLTVMGQFAQAIVGSKIQNNRFTIKTDKPNVEVSWLVTGVRRDAFANAHRIPVEVEKPEKERGTYLSPELFGAPEEQGAAWARHPAAMKRWKKLRTTGTDSKPADAALAQQ